MAEKNYREYLAARVLSEHKPVTYRLLSRALRVHVNHAKQMLFDFHQKQNAKKPKSVHATYLIAGTQRISKTVSSFVEQDGGDITMRSSPFMSSMPEPELAEESVEQTAIVLAREEELETTRAEFEDGASIHIYSLEPGPIENLNVLSACNQEIHTDYANEDPLQRWKTYGSIRNPHIKRRTAKHAPPPIASTSKAPSKATAKPAAKIEVEEKEAAMPAQGESISEGNASGRSTPQPLGASSSLRRSDSESGLKKNKSAGDIFKSFAKAKTKPKEIEKPRQSTSTPDEDEPMQGMSEDEEDADNDLEIKIDHEKDEASRKARHDRAEKLRKMMEMEDEDLPGTPPESSPAATPDAPEAVEAEPTVTVTNGRRRGRRRVMKKKKVKDEDGYLVTKEEAVWESFSEAEPEPKKLKPAPVKSSSTAKGKGGGKQGQGSIASFFRKG